MEVRVDVTPVRALLEKLRALRRSVDDFQPLWDRLAGVMIEVELEWFSTEGDGSWPPLAESTLKAKARDGYPLDPLVRTGALLESLTTPLAGQVDQGRSTLGTFGLKTFSWGTDVTDDRGQQYAHFHQGVDPLLGTPVDYPGLPRRQVIEWPVADSTRAAIEAAMESYLEERVKEAGLA